MAISGVFGSQNLYNNYGLNNASLNTNNSVQTQTNPFSVQSTETKATGDVFVKSTGNSSNINQKGQLAGTKMAQSLAWVDSTIAMEHMCSISSKTISDAIKPLSTEFIDKVFSYFNSFNASIDDSSISEEKFEKQLDEATKQMKPYVEAVNLKLELIGTIDKVTAPFSKETAGGYKDLDPTAAAAISGPLSDIVSGNLDLTKAKNTNDSKQIKANFINSIIKSMQKQIKDLGGDPDKDDDIPKNAIKSSSESKSSDSTSSANDDKTKKLSILKQIVKKFKESIKNIDSNASVK